MKKFLLLLILISLASCSKEKNNGIQMSFYYWKTHFSLSDLEQSFIKENKIDKMYVRYFDVALKNNKAIPVSAITFDSIPKNLKIVPVIYIKNEVVLNVSVDLNELSDQMLKYIAQINEKHNIDATELQFDCDWSLKSKDRFFALIEMIKQKATYNLSATIRLHQIKYQEKTGIPNVDRGVLMYYNMGTIAGDSLNSIYDRNIAKKYINALENYPLELDIALPIYSWAIHLRKDKPINLISRIRANQLDSLKEFKKITTNKYLVAETNTHFGNFFKEGDVLKIESIKPKQIEEMISDLSSKMNKIPKEIIFYDFDQTNINTYEKEFFKEVITAF